MELGVALFGRKKDDEAGGRGRAEQREQRELDPAPRAARSPDHQPVVDLVDLEAMARGKVSGPVSLSIIAKFVEEISS